MMGSKRWPEGDLYTYMYAAWNIRVGASIIASLLAMLITLYHRRYQSVANMCTAVRRSEG
jgi:hypothetical protein